MLGGPAVIAHVELGDGTKFEVEACVKGHILALNQHLVDNPKLMLADDHRAYLCIIKPRKEAEIMAQLGQPFVKKRKPLDDDEC